MAQLYFKYGAMGSSKTANALMARFNYEERGQATLLVKPRLDTRRRSNSDNKSFLFFHSKILLCKYILPQKRTF